MKIFYHARLLQCFYRKWYRPTVVLLTHRLPRILLIQEHIHKNSYTVVSPRKVGDENICNIIYNLHIHVTHPCIFTSSAVTIVMVKIYEFLIVAVRLSAFPDKLQLFEDLVNTNIFL